MKKKISYLILSLFLVLALTPNAFGEDKLEDVELTLDQAIEMALKHSNEMKQIEYDIERGEEVRESAADKVKFIPSGAGSDSQAASAFTALVATDLGLQMTKKGKSLEEDKIVLNVFNKYTEVLNTTETLELAKLQQDKAKQDWQVTLLSHDVGVISWSQLKLAESGHKSANISYELAQKDVDKAYLEFNTLIGLKPQDRSLLTDEIEFVPIEVEDLDHAIVRIMDGNPAIWLAEQQVDLKNIELSLYNWGDPVREPYGAKIIDVEKAELSAIDVKREMRSGLRNIYQEILQLEDNYRLAEQGLKVAEEDYKIKKIQYDVGVISKQDYLNSEMALAEAENDFNKLVYLHESLKQTFYKPWAYDPMQQ